MFIGFEFLIHESLNSYNFFMNIRNYYFFSPTTHIGLRPLIVKVSKSLLDTHTHTRGLPRKSDHLFADVNTIFKPSVGFKLAVPTIKPKQTYALDHKITGNNKHLFTCSIQFLITIV